MSRDFLRVAKKVVKASRDGKEFDFDVTRYYSTAYGGEPRVTPPSVDPFVEVWADGSITLHSRGEMVFLYDEEWLCIIKAVEQALQDKKQKHEEKRQKWLYETADLKKFYGTNVDLSRNETIEALKHCNISVIQRNRYTDPLIFFNDKYYILGRTDLIDNVVTGLCKQKTAEEWRAHYLRIAKTCMGSRLDEFESGGCFSVIDSLTDG